MRETQAFREQIGRIEELVQGIDTTADPVTRAAAKELVQSVMDLHGAAFERILEIVRRTVGSGASLVRSLAADSLIGSLLVLYDLHPDNFPTRVNRGMERAQQILAKRGATIQVVAVGDSTVRLKIDTNGHNCGATAAELQEIVRSSLFDVAPDAAEVIIEPPQSSSASGFVPLDSLQVPNGSVPARVLNSS